MLVVAESATAPLSVSRVEVAVGPLDTTVVVDVVWTFLVVVAAVCEVELVSRVDACVVAVAALIVPAWKATDGSG